jgi:hypothetical protein
MTSWSCTRDWKGAGRGWFLPDIHWKDETKLRRTSDRNRVVPNVRQRCVDSEATWSVVTLNMAALDLKGCVLWYPSADVCENLPVSLGSVKQFYSCFEDLKPTISFINIPYHLAAFRLIVVELRYFGTELLGFWAFSIVWYSREHDVSETGSVSVLRWRWGRRHLLSCAL